MHYNSACTNSATIENKTNKIRITSNMGNASASLHLGISHKQRSSRGQRKNEKKPTKINKKNDSKKLEKFVLKLQENHNKNLKD